MSNRRSSIEPTTFADKQIQVREFRYPEDYPAARSLWENAGPGIQLRHSDESDEIQKKLQRDPDLFLVAESYWKDDRYGYWRF